MTNDGVSLRLEPFRLIDLKCVAWVGWELGRSRQRVSRVVDWH
jgi:hypothetical protein